jgi:hypothetical protein
MASVWNVRGSLSERILQDDPELTPRPKYEIRGRQVGAARYLHIGSLDSGSTIQVHHPTLIYQSNDKLNIFKYFEEMDRLRPPKSASQLRLSV